MTNEEAVKRLEDARCSPYMKEAINIGIAAIKELMEIKTHEELTRTHEELTRTHASDSSEHETHEERTEGDCISRKAAIQAVTHFDDSLKRLYELPSVNPAKPCGDYISRQAVIDHINRLIDVEKKQGTDDWGYGRERVNAYEAMLHFVKSEYLYPSVEPERKVGKWIRFIEGDDIIHTGYMCSECEKGDADDDCNSY